MKTAEAILHEHVCDYLRLQYKDVIFRTDHSAGLRMTMQQAVRHKRLQSGRAYPDLFIAEPRGGYHGLYLELKASSVYLKNGNLTSNKHVQEQEAMLQQLRKRGYKAEFVYGFEAATKLIDSYMKLAR